MTERNIIQLQDSMNRSLYTSMETLINLADTLPLIQVAFTKEQDKYFMIESSWTGALNDDKFMDNVISKREIPFTYDIPYQYKINTTKELIESVKVVHNINLREFYIVDVC